MPRVEIQTIRDGLAARVVDTRPVTRTAFVNFRDALLAETPSIHLGRCVNNLNGVIDALLAGDVDAAVALAIPVCVHSLDNWLA